MSTKRLVDYDPLTGISCFMNFDHAQEKVFISHEQDVQKALDVAQFLRNDDSYTRDGIKRDFLHYAIVPPTVQMEMKAKHGVDFWKTENDAKVYSLLNSDYSRFKVTEIVHAIRKGR